MVGSLKYELRRAGAGDAGALAAIGARTFIETFGHLYDPADLDAFLAEKHSVATNERLLADPAFALWLLEAGREPVGYAVAGPCRLPAPNMPETAGELARLYVSKEAQGGGLGGRLLEEALDWMRARFHPIYLSVYAENHGAQRLYARHGFRKIHEYEYMVGAHADPEWIMELRARLK